MGHCALLVTGAHGRDARVRRDAPGIEAASVAVTVDDQAVPDLPRSSIAEAAGATDKPEVIVGIRGGSCLDLAEAPPAVLANGGDVRDDFAEF